MDNATDTYTKTCTKCGDVKGAEGFYRRPEVKDGLASACKSCMKAYKTSPELKAAQIKAIAKIDFTTYTKACNKCGEVNGAEGFHRKSEAKDGLRTTCKSCIKAHQTSVRFNTARLGAVAKIDLTTYTKACTKCKEVKGADGFSKSNQSKDGLYPSCKSCMKAYLTSYRASPEGKTAQMKVIADAAKIDLTTYTKACTKCKEVKGADGFDKKNLAKDGLNSICKSCGAAQAADYYEANKAERLAQVTAYAKANPEKVRARNAKHRAAKLERTPDWLTNDELDYMKSIYAIAVEAQKIEGEEKHVDHLVPLRGKDVSGLHVPWNLVLLPAIDNIKKSNKFCIDGYNARWHNT